MFVFFFSYSKSRVKPQAAKLRCFLNYFNRMSFHGEEGAPGTICFTRQVSQSVSQLLTSVPGVSVCLSTELLECNISHGEYSCYYKVYFLIDELAAASYWYR